MRFTLLILIFFCWFQSNAQYWFGPKVGLQRTDFIYQDDEYKKDSTFDIGADYGFHAGGVIIYQVDDRYAVHGELLWERLTKLVTEKEGEPVPIYSKSNYNYLSVPFSFQINLGRGPVHLYAGIGPKISYFLGGTGLLDLDEFDEASGEPKDYRFVFKQQKSDGVTRLAVPEANRWQFSLTANAGTFLDLQGGGRLSIDLRYSFGHSNVGFNDNPDFNDFVGYSENFRYRQNILSLSLSYLFEFDVAEQSKGMSTLEDSNKKKKKKKK